MKKENQKTKHIPTAEIKQDILDTQAEIEQMEREARHLEATPFGMQETRWNHMRAEGRRAGIKERKEFIEKLEAILEIRGKKKEKPLARGNIG